LPLNFPFNRMANIVDDHYSYGGAMLFVGDDRSVQQIEPGVLVIHDSSTWLFEPVAGEHYNVEYQDGVSVISRHD
jgi:hypothetical protein